MDAELSIPKYERLIFLIAGERIPGSPHWDDAIQEARIRVWELHRDGQTPSSGYVAAAIRRRLVEVVVRQTWTGHTGKHNRRVDPGRFATELPPVYVPREPVKPYRDADTVASALLLLTETQREYVRRRFWEQAPVQESAPMRGVRRRLAPVLAHLVA